MSGFAGGPQGTEAVAYCWANPLLMAMARVEPFATGLAAPFRRLRVPCGAGGASEGRGWRLSVGARL